MWHKISNGDPITDSSIKEPSYIVLDDNKKGKASFQLALVRGNDVLKSLSDFQKITGITSGKGEAVFNVNNSEVDQWMDPSKNGGSNHVPNRIENSREGLMICLFSGGTIRGTANSPTPHCHAMLAGFDSLNSSTDLKGGFPAVGGHLGGATVNVVLEMHVDSYPEVIEKEPGGPLGGSLLTVSAAQQSAAKKFSREKQTVKE